MKDFLLKDGDHYIECEIDGSKLTYTYSTDPKCHSVLTLRNEDSYNRLKRAINAEYWCSEDRDNAFTMVSDFLETSDRDEFFTDDSGYLYCDIRTRDEIESYENEAFDKVWYMRSRPCENPKIEADRRASIKRILNTYNDIPKKGYTDWECGYWNGIMGALRWVLGDEKDSLDT